MKNSFQSLGSERETIKIVTKIVNVMPASNATVV